MRGTSFVGVPMTSLTRSWRQAASLALIAGTVVVGDGCNHTPIARIDKTFTLQVKQGSGTGEAIEVDFLWVVDNSASMCQ